MLRYWTVRDKFNGVEETLMDIGVERVEVRDDGLLFVMDKAETSNQKVCRRCKSRTEL